MAKPTVELLPLLMTLLVFIAFALANEDEEFETLGLSPLVEFIKALLLGLLPLAERLLIIFAVPEGEPKV